MNPHIWGPDAAEFRPERWDKLEGDAASVYAFESFSNGPRTCPGRALALLEIKAVLVEVLTRFEITSVRRELEFQNPSLILSAKEGVEVIVRRLEQTEQ
jgi:cytochrome P450